MFNTSHQANQPFSNAFLAVGQTPALWALLKQSHSRWMIFKFYRPLVRLIACVQVAVCVANWPEEHSQVKQKVLGSTPYPTTNYLGSDQSEVTSTRSVTAVKVWRSNVTRQCFSPYNLGLAGENVGTFLAYNLGLAGKTIRTNYPVCIQLGDLLGIHLGLAGETIPTNYPMCIQLGVARLSTPECPSFTWSSVIASH